jgi:hypothetical protein
MGRGLSHARAPEDIRTSGARDLEFGSRGDVVTVTAQNWHDELVLMTELSSVNNQIARFVLRLLDADAGQAEHVSVTDEGNLGLRLVDLGYALQHRAVYRAAVLENGGMPIELQGAQRRIESNQRMTRAGGRP